MKLLQLKAVSFAYVGFSLRSLGSSQLALENVNLTLEASKHISLVGPNGSGKTTLLNLIGGLTKPSSGQIVRQGVENVAFLSQLETEIGWMPITVGEILKMSSYKHRGYFRRMNKVDQARVENAAERMEIKDLEAKQFNSLSKGERQRVRVSLALAQEPDLLIMDEPLSGLDIPSQERIKKVTQEEKNRGAVVAISTHSLEEAGQADEVLLMDGGVVAQGEPAQTLTEENLRNIYKDRLQVLSDQTLTVVDHHI